ncbi:MAG: LCP family protein [Pseudonocardiales bacterium]
MTEATSPVTRLPRRGHALFTGKLLVGMLTCLVFLAAAVGWTTTRWLDAQLRDVLALDPHSGAITDAEGQRGDENILLVGSDSRAGAQRSDQVGDATAVQGARSDTVMIAHIPADRSRIVIVSFPRDLQIRRPPCLGWDPATGSYTGPQDAGADVAKLNSAYEVGGPLCLTRVVQHLSGLAVTRFVAVDFQGFKGVVDAMGGVGVCVERPLKDTTLGTIIPQAGYRTISGKTALDFVRARHVVGDPTGDYGRIARQQRFLSALLRELLSPGVLLNPVRFRAVTDAVAANTLGENIGTSALLSLGRSLDGMDPADVTFVTVPTTGVANEYGNEELRGKNTAALFRAIIDGTEIIDSTAIIDSTGLRGETQAAQQPKGPTLAAPDVAVRVLNGAGITGAAASASRALRAVGFGVLEVGNSEQRVDSTTIRYPKDREAEALALLAALPDAVLQPDQSLIGAVVLVVGPDFEADIDPDSARQAHTTALGLGKPGPLATVNAADTTCS